MPHLSMSKTGSLIHTDRDGTCNTVGVPKKYPRCDYRKNCPPPANVALWAINKNFWEAHHMLPHEVVNGYIGDPQQAYIDAIYHLTDWCMNQPPNMIALPFIATYKEEPASRTLDLPCHDWDHNTAGGYNVEVMQDLENNIWSQLRQAQAALIHFDENNVLAAFQALEALWEARLNARGQRNGGIVASWANRFVPASNWWYAWSMGNLACVQNQGPWTADAAWV